MMTLGRLHFHHRLTLQDLFFRSANLGITHHTTFEQQVARRGPRPAVYGDRRFALAGPGNHPTHPLQLFVDILHRFNRRIEQLAESISDQFRAGVLNKIGFTGLSNERERQRV